MNNIGDIIVMKIMVNKNTEACSYEKLRIRVKFNMVAPTAIISARLRL